MKKEIRKKYCAYYLRHGSGKNEECGNCLYEKKGVCIQPNCEHFKSKVKEEK